MRHVWMTLSQTSSFCPGCCRCKDELLFYQQWLICWEEEPLILQRRKVNQNLQQEDLLNLDVVGCLNVPCSLLQDSFWILHRFLAFTHYWEHFKVDLTWLTIAKILPVLLLYYKENHILDSSLLVAEASSTLHLLLVLFFPLGERGETSLSGTPPSCGNGFPGPLLCQLLAAVVLQSKRCRNPLSGPCLWLRIVCVCVSESEMGCGWGKMSMIYMQVTLYISVDTHACFASSFNLNLHLDKSWYLMALYMSCSGF